MVTQNFTVLVRIQFLHCRFLSSIDKRDGNEIAVIHYSEMIAWYKKNTHTT
jgi:hypothetical protein